MSASPRLAAAASLCLAVAAALAPALEPEGYIFPGGDWRLEDWNGDGADDMAVLAPDGRLLVWLARPGERAYFRLRPDFDVAPPERCASLFRVFAPPEAEEGAPPEPVLVATDPDGVLAWSASAGGAWERVWSGPLMARPPADGPLDRAPAGANLDASAALPDLDGDGSLDLIVCGRDGRWRVVWGPLRPGVPASAAELFESAFHREARLAGEGRAPSVLFGYGRSSGAWLGGGPRTREIFRANSAVRSGAVSGGGEALRLSSRAMPTPLDEGEAESGEAGAPSRAVWSEFAEWRPGANPPLLDVWTRRRVWRQVAPRQFEPEPNPPEDDALLIEAPAPLPGFDAETRLELMIEEMSRLRAAEDFDHARFEDINGDGNLDAFYIFGSDDPLRPRANIRVYLGDGRGLGDRGGADGGGGNESLDYRRPDSSLRTRAILLWPKLVDIDGDGDLDTALFFPSVNYASPSEQLKAYLQLGIPGTLRVYLWENGSGYSEANSFAIDLNLRHEVFGMRLPNLSDARLIGDHDGDGVLDLGFLSGKRTYTVWRFDPRRGFGSRPLSEIQTPDPITRVEARDIDGDGRDDLIFVTASDERGRETALRVYLFRASP